MLKKIVPAGLVTALALALPNVAFAQGATSGGQGWGHLSAAIVLAIAAAAGALGQGKAAAAACEGMARNPGAAAQIRAMAFLGLVLIESLVIYALVIAFVVQGK
ncbi:MAG: ATP synthase F0 subunit C [Acidobacteria bacterium]|nr:ATP synthase F0 subunit C [Acidobacteriota bacterium]